MLDVDIQKYFDTIDHGQLRQFLARRVVDGVVRKLIDKWLKADILESGGISYPVQGTPQGGVISPLLANIYLQYVLDDWFIQTVRPRLRGRCSLTRFADDSVMVFEHHDDCRRFEEVLTKRFERYGLKLHPEKTQCVDFRPNHREENKRCGNVTFDFSEDNLAKVAQSTFAEELHYMGEIQPVPEPLPLGTAENPSSVLPGLSASEPITMRSRMR